MIYLDNAATTRLAPEVLEAMLPWLRERFGNPGSLHRLGAEAAGALARAREQVAAALAAEPDEVVFTGGGTEANALAIAGAVAARRRRGDHVVVSAVEHPAVAETLRQLQEREGLRVTVLPVDPERGLTPAAVAAAVEDQTILVSVMHVQNETGAVFPVEELARAAKAKSRKLLVHADGVQALGKLPAPGPEVDLYAVSAHKVHGPKGAGALRVRRGVHLVPLVRGGGQEGGLRGGTENVAALVGFGVAAELAVAARAGLRARAATLGARLREGVLALGGVINSPADAFPTLLNASFPDLLAEPLLHALEAREVFVSTAAACRTRKGKRSAVLQALGVRGARLASALRFALSRETTAEEVEGALLALGEALSELRAGAAAAR
ncbi:MAG: cysteine desulfurase family protein [Planctomycetota bacterium]